MRSMRRGMKEMDLILSAYAQSRLNTMEPDRLSLYDDMLNENDQDLYRWITGQEEAPETYRLLVADIRRHMLN
ncbi:succinate dehydrogenase assembly factor 2 [Aestuariibius insulae]|uniref:succinate dehydrogenase assembly factor 2 n=1 Tax=Aestuariibius insulae TaxID=2058287 RepID=UPI0034741F29